MKLGISHPFPAQVWNAGVLLAAHVAGAALAPGLRVLEVGAGCGLAAVVAAKRGCRVLATDRGAAPPWAVQIFNPTSMSLDSFDASLCVVLREFDESDRFVQASAESTSM